MTLARVVLPLKSQAIRESRVESSVSGLKRHFGTQAGTFFKVAVDERASGWKFASHLCLNGGHTCEEM